MLTDVAKLVTDLGAFPTVRAVVVVIEHRCWRTRGARCSELLVLVGGFALIYVGVHVTKAGIDRPRPADPLVDTTGPPSRAATPPTRPPGSPRRVVLHAAICGLASAALVIAARSCWRRRSACRASTCAPTTGPTWPAAGGSGSAIFGLLAAIALVVEYIRHNGQTARSEPARARGAMNLDLVLDRDRDRAGRRAGGRRATLS